MDRGLLEAEVAELAARMSEISGMTLRAGELGRVERAFRELVTDQGSSVEACLRGVRSDRAMLEALLERLVIGETYFFREPSHFEFIRTVVLPRALSARGSGERVRMWSAACATGEEAYSLAIIGEEQGVSDRLEVIGTDLSESFLRRAQEGVYRRWSLRSSEAGRVLRFMTSRSSQQHVLDARIRQRVRFMRHNLSEGGWEERGLGQFDLILCRNVLIYMEAPMISVIARRLSCALREGGWLITASSDPPLMDEEGLERVSTSGGVFYRRREVGSLATEEEAGVRRRARPGAPRRPLSPVSDERAEAGWMVEAQEAFDGGEYQRAAALLERCVGEAAVLLRVKALCNVDPARAEEACRAAITQWPLSTGPQLLLAVVLMARGARAEALSCVRKALCLEPGDAEANALWRLLRGEEVSGEESVTAPCGEPRRAVVEEGGEPDGPESGDGIGG